MHGVAIQARFACLQRAKDAKLEELNHLRQHDIECKKLKHRLELDLKREKVKNFSLHEIHGTRSRTKAFGARIISRSWTDAHDLLNIQIGACGRRRPRTAASQGSV